MFRILLVAVVGLGSINGRAAATDAAPEPAPQIAIEGRYMPRTWTDHTGTRHATATFLDADRHNVRVRKSSGAEVNVPLAKLSTSDQDWVASQLSDAVQSASAGFAGRIWEGLALARLPDQVVQLLTPADETRELVRDVQANAVYVQVSEKFLNRLLPRNRSHRAPVSDVILGAQVRGQAHTRSTLRLDLVPSSTGAVSDLLVTGRSDSRTTSYSYPVQLHGHAVTVFSARKRVIAGDDRVVILPTVSAARSQSVTDSITSSLPRLRGRISVRIAAREVAGKRGKIDYISARHAEQRVNRTVDQLVARSLAEMPEIVRTVLRQGKSSVPVRVVSRSTDDRLQVSLLPKNKAIGDELPAPPTIQSDADIVVQIHSPLLNRALSRVDMKDAVRRALAQTAKARIVRLVSTQASAAPHWTLRWSGDHRWVTFTWSETPTKRVIEDKVASAP